MRSLSYQCCARLARYRRVCTLAKLSEALDVQPYRFFLAVQNERHGKNETLSAFSDDVLNQISKIIRETAERYE